LEKNLKKLTNYVWLFNNLRQWTILTHYFDVENNYNSEINMVVFDILKQFILSRVKNGLL
jgi:hypothetical protein